MEHCQSYCEVIPVRRGDTPEKLQAVTQCYQEVRDTDHSHSRLQPNTSVCSQLLQWNTGVSGGGSRWSSQSPVGQGSSPCLCCGALLSPSPSDCQAQENQIMGWRARLQTTCWAPHSSCELCYQWPSSSVRAFTTHLCSALLVQDFEDVFGNLLQLMPCFITLLTHTIKENHALVTLMAWRFILKRADTSEISLPVPVITCGNLSSPDCGKQLTLTQKHLLWLSPGRKQCQRESLKSGVKAHNGKCNLLLWILCVSTRTESEDANGCPSKLSPGSIFCSRSVNRRQMFRNSVTLSTYKSIEKKDAAQLLKFCLAHPKESEICVIYFIATVYI